MLPAHVAQPRQRPPTDHAGFLLDALTPMTDNIKRALDAQNDPGAGKNQPSPAQARAARALIAQAVALRNAGRVRESILPLRRAVEADPSDPRAHFDLGLTLLKCQHRVEAVASLQKAAALKPDYADAYHHLGLALEAIAEDQPAIAAFRRAVLLDPKLTDAYSRLGCLLQAAGREAEAADAFRHAIAAGSRTTLGRVCEARLLVLQEKFTEAADLLRRTLARSPDNLDALMLLAHILIFAGDVDGAAAHYAKAITLAPNEVLPMTAFTQVRKITEADRPFVGTMIDFLKRAGLADTQRMELHFAIGKCHDDLREYELAMTHFDAANHIRHRFSGFRREPSERLVTISMNQCSQKFFADRAAIGSTDETPVLILGMPRSGTTLVETIVSSHPSVVGAGELPFWMNHASVMDRHGPEGVTADVVQGLAAEYITLLRGFSSHALRITDKMPFNFLWLGLILTAFPRARIIHCRRHPVDTCLSIYFTNFQMRQAFVSSRRDLVTYYRHYQQLMEHWRAVLPPDRFTEVEYETLIADRDSETRRLIAFCGLEWDEDCLAPEQNRRVVKTASMWQARQPVYRSSLARWKRYEPWLGSLRELLPPEPTQA